MSCFWWLLIGFVVGANFGVCLMGMLRVANADDRERTDIGQVDAACEKLLNWTPGSFTNIADGLRRIEERKEN